MQIKNTIIAVVSIFLVKTTSAQAPTFSHGTTPYTTILNGTSVVDTAWDDLDGILPIPLGFTFTANGIAYDSININDAFINLNKNSSSLDVGFGFDLFDVGFNNKVLTSTIKYNKTGVSPNRKFEIEWKNAAFYNEYDIDSTTIERLTFKITLNENNSKVEVHTGLNTLNGVVPAFLEGLFVFSNMDNGNTPLLYALEGSASNPSLTNDINSGGLTSFPLENKVYNFVYSKTAATKSSVIEKSLYFVSGTLFAINTPSKLVEIYDITGKLLQTVTLQNKTVNLSDLKDGVYIAKTQTTNGIETLQFIK